MVSITVENGSCRIQGLDPGQLETLRYSVAYQAQPLPPVGCQLAIRGLVGEVMSEQHLQRPPPAHRVFAWALNSASCRRQFSQHNWEPTLSAVAATMRQRGVWDGWSSMVSTSGHFGAGLLDTVQRACRCRLGLQPSLRDTRPRPALGRPVGTMPPLFDFQQEALEAFLTEHRGVLDLPPRSGKTRIATAIIHRLGLRTLYMTPRKHLVGQTVAAINRFLGEGTALAIVGQPKSVKAQRALARALVWVCTPQTAAGPNRAARKGGKLYTGLPNIHTRELLVVDEFHHAAAPTYREVATLAVNAYYRLGLTGTHFRADGRDMEMESVISRAVYSRTVQDMVEQGRLVPARIAMIDNMLFW